jgi:hypothetical protein
MSANVPTRHAGTVARTHAGPGRPGQRVARGGRRSRRAQSEQGLRFPCGHVEVNAAVASRVHETLRAVWVGCRYCNVIAVVWR